MKLTSSIEDALDTMPRAVPPAHVATDDPSVLLTTPEPPSGARCGSFFQTSDAELQGQDFGAPPPAGCNCHGTYPCPAATPPNTALREGEVMDGSWRL